jgi:hypothetical protein
MVGHGHGLDLVMGDIDHGQPEPLLQVADLDAHLRAQLGVEIGQRLVHQADRALRDDGARQRHALLLAAGKLVGTRSRSVSSPIIRATRISRSSRSSFATRRP